MTATTIRRTVGLLMAGLSFAVCDRASGQSRSLFGNQGPINQSRTGGGAGGPALTGGGVAAPEQSGLNTELGALSQNVGQGFVGGGNEEGRFVGSRLAGEQTTPGGAAGAFNAFSNFNRNNNQFSGAAGRNLNNFNAGTTTRRTIRPRQQIAFTYPRQAAQTVTTSLETRWTKISDRIAVDGASNIAFELDDAGQLTLRGEVASARSRKMAELLARMEPGVRSVRNELVLSESTSTE